MTDLKVVSSEQPTQPTYPATNIQIMPQGVVINVMFGADLTIGKMIDANTMDDLCRQWQQSRKQLQRDQAAMTEVLRRPLHNRQ